MSGVEDELMIEALAPDRADQPLDATVLPRRSRLRGSVVETEAPHVCAEDRPVGAVVVAHKHAGPRTRGEGRGDLAGQPECRGMVGHFHAQNAATFVRKDDEDVETLSQPAICSGDQLRANFTATACRNRAFLAS